MPPAGPAVSRLMELKNRLLTEPGDTLVQLALYGDIVDPVRRRVIVPYGLRGDLSNSDS